MSNGGHDDDDIPITKRVNCWPGMVAAAVAGGIAGYLICQFVSDKETAELEQESPTAISQPYETTDTVE